jgi:hypothetical protein
MDNPAKNSLFLKTFMCLGIRSPVNNKLVNLFNYVIPNLWHLDCVKQIFTDQSLSSFVYVWLAILKRPRSLSNLAYACLEILERDRGLFSFAYAWLAILKRPRSLSNLAYACLLILERDRGLFNFINIHLPNFEM